MRTEHPAEEEEDDEVRVLVETDHMGIEEDCGHVDKERFEYEFCEEPPAFTHPDSMPCLTSHKRSCPVCELELVRTSKIWVVSNGCDMRRLTHQEPARATIHRTGKTRSGYSYCKPTVPSDKSIQLPVLFAIQHIRKYLRFRQAGQSGQVITDLQMFSWLGLSLRPPWPRRNP